MKQKKGTTFSQKKKRRLVIPGIVLLSLIFNLIFPLPLHAQVLTFDLAEVMAQKMGDTLEGARDVEQRARETLWKTLIHIVYVAAKKTIHSFINQAAYDTAVWLATGAKGQGPMFYQEGWGEYLTNLADQAAGTFIQSLGQELPAGFGLKTCTTRTVKNMTAEEYDRFRDEEKKKNPRALLSLDKQYKDGKPTGYSLVEICTPGWQFDFCEPDFAFKASLGLGLAQIRKPRQPRECGIKEMIKNWEEFTQDPNFLNRFSFQFTPEQNDILIGLQVFDKYSEAVVAEVTKGTKERETSEGDFIPVKDRLGTKILTPVGLVRERAWQLIAEGKIEADEVYPGDIFTYALGTFIDTLVYKLAEQIFKKGLALLGGKGKKESGPKSSGLTFSDRDLYSAEEGVSLSEGKQAAEARFIDLITANMGIGGPYDFLTKFVSCPNPDSPGPDECVIDQKFRIAIEKGLTVREAIDQGFLDGNAAFGFNPQGFQPPYNEGYPYRSLVILRAYRIIPVTWEIAALAISKFHQGDIYNLNTLINLYDNSASDNDFYHLIDENWVLKAPLHYCKAEGYGPNIVFDSLVAGQDSNNDGDFDDPTDIRPQRIVHRNTYCADYQSCIEKDVGGNCIYGYCSEEKRIWNLQGNSCPDYYNTCQTFGDRSGNIVSYLKNSLDYNNCSIDNVGCRWYCQAYNTVNNVWTCVNEGERVLKPCTQIGGCALSASCDIYEGESFCSDQVRGVDLVISSPCSSGSQWWDGSKCAVTANCTIAQGGVECSQTGCETLANLLPNPSFETGAPPGQLADKWTGDLTYFERVSGALEQVYSGSNSLRFYNVGGPAGGSKAGVFFQSNPFALPAGNYTFAGFIYNHLNAGQIEIFLNNEATPRKTSSAKNQWEELSFDFTATGSDIIKIKVSGDQVSGTAWFDNFKVSASCIVNPVQLTLVGTVDQDQSKLHFDRDAKECRSEADGCSQFIRLKENLGTNVIVNSSFEDWSDPNRLPAGWTGSGISRTDRDSAVGNLSLILAGGQDLTTNLNFVTPAAGYYLSFWAKANIQTKDALMAKLTWQAAGSPNESNFQLNGDDSLDLITDWQRFVMDATSTAALGSDFSLRFVNQGGNNIYLDGIQLEPIDINGSYSAYKDYAQVNLTYLRQAPDYLSCQGYTLERPSPYVLEGVTEATCQGENLIWRADKCDSSGTYCCHQIDPGECFNYAMYCQADEVGCNAYQPVLGGPAIPAVVAFDDYCPAECVGYQAYKQSPTYFESQQSLEYFIPRTARQCNITVAGCDEFTNLDEVAKGGEGREYYTYLRHCEKSSEGANCSNYYTWQGSDETGYQLRVYNLVANTGGTPKEVIPYNPANPASVNWLEYWCNDKSVGLNNRPVCCDGPEDIITNPFCKEFYAVDGNIYYQIYANTVSCFEDCHPFRKTRLGESDTEAQNNCNASNGQWSNNACLYQAIPAQGISCPASAAGCREYRGNTGANVYTVLFEDFEAGKTTGWRYGQISSEALTVAGHSIKTGGGFASSWGILKLAGLETACNPGTFRLCDEKNSTDYDCYQASVGKCLARDEVNSETCLVEIGESRCGIINNLIRPNKFYTISFWAKSADSNVVSDTAIRLATGGPAGPESYFGLATTTIAVDWKYYSFGPFVYNELQTDSRLQFAASRDIYLDNIKIKEIQDYVYVIKKSWQTPTSCDTNPYISPPRPAPQFMLGCAQYRDLDNRIHNLKSFNHLCRESAVGCEALIDTQNSSSPFAQEFNIGDEIGYLKVPADQLIYLVNRPEFQCNALDKGCQRLGLPTLNQNNKVIGYNNVYLINNPDQYSSSLCGSPEVGCEEFQTARGFSYFKNPGSRSCQYRQIPNQTNYGWFKSGSTALVPDCPVTRSPLGVIHPAGWVGLCPADFSTCTEVVDPISDIAKNLVFNADLKQDVDNNNIPDGWKEISSIGLQQTLYLKNNTLYTLSFQGTGTSGLNSANNLSIEIIDCPGATSFDHSMVSPLNTLKIPTEVYVGDWGRRTGLPDSRQFSGRFYLPHDFPVGSQCKLLITANTIDLIKSLIQKVAVRETGVYYALKDTLDFTGCNGLVNPEENCVLFNDRGSVNYKLGETDNSYLVFDADVSGPKANSSIPVADCGGVCDSNVILKVRPDRTCGQWLACRTKIKSVDKEGKERDYCLELAACDSLDEKGNCNSLVLPLRQKVNPDNSNLTVADKTQLANLSGYVKAGMTQGDFNNVNQTIKGYYPYNLMEQIGEVAKVTNSNFESFYQTGQPVGWTTRGVVWNENHFKVINDPVTAQQKEGVTIKEGKSILKLSIGGANQAVSDEFDVFPDTKYIVTANINTLNLKPEGAEARLEIIDPGSLVPTVLKTLSLKSGKDWQEILDSFTTDPSTVRLQIKLYNWLDVDSQKGVCDDILAPLGVCDFEGSSYFDQIEIRPVLEVQKPTFVDKNGDTIPDEANYLASSCRLYPASDSLSCDYLDDSGFRYHGLLGYCLISDPNNPDVCLQWWPVDLIKGDIFGSYPGYQGGAPLFYCVQSESIPNVAHCAPESTTCQLYDSGADAQMVLEFDYPVPDIPGMPEIEIRESHCTHSGHEWCEYFDVYGKNNKNSEWELYAKCLVGDPLQWPPGTLNPRCSDPNNTRAKVEFKPGGVCYKGMSTFLIDVGKFEKYNTIQYLKIVMNQVSCDGADFDFPRGDIRSTIARVCHAVAQVVTSAGSNKAWLNRISEGSQYLVPDLGIFYSYDWPPFGSAVPPAPLDNPILWQERLFFQGPDYSLSAPYQVRSGWPYDFDPSNIYASADVNSAISRLKKLFAKSYGIWLWDENTGAYSKVIQTVCTGGATPGKPECNPNIGCPDQQGSCKDKNPATPGVVEGSCYDGSPCTINPAPAVLECDVNPGICEFKCTTTENPCSTYGEICDSTSDPPGVCGRCSTGTANGRAACTSDIECHVLTDCYSTCDSNSGRKKDQSCTSIINGTCVSGECKGGAYDGLNCSRDANCNECTDPGACVQVNWDVPNTLCLNNVRQAPNDYCAIPPKVTKFLVNGKEGGSLRLLNTLGSGQIITQFNVVIDGNQLPLTAYQIDWGDTKKSAVTGVDLRDKSDPDQPFVLYHHYDYYQLLSNNKSRPDDDAIYCFGEDTTTRPSWAADVPTDLLKSGQCAVKPKIQVFDNWGWCNGNVAPGYYSSACFNNPNAWTYFPGLIIVGLSD